MNQTRIFLLVLLPVVLAISPAPARSVTAERELTHSASGFCETNNPEFDAQVRRRPTELRNVGSQAVVVTCGVATDKQVGSTPMNTAVRFRNNRATTGTASCTITAGAFFDSQLTVKKEVTLAGGQTGTTNFDHDEFGDFKQFSFSCTLPWGWSILELWVQSEDEVLN